MNKHTPKHIEAGQKAKLRIGARGECVIVLSILNEETGDEELSDFLIDLGFNGYLQLSEQIVEKLHLKIIGRNITTGFDGVSKEIGIVKTKIKLLDLEFANFPIQVIKNGIHLIGTSLLKDAQQMLVVDYRSGRITLTMDKKVQKKVNKSIDKYAK